MGKQLFGTDGIRGTAGTYPLDPPTVHAFGRALGAVAVRHAPSPVVVIGSDTRESSPWMAAQVAGGLAREGVHTSFAGVITTPGVAFLTRTDSFVAGVMISASHNAYQDNGIKVFGRSGYKLPDEEEHEIEQSIFELLEQGAESGERTLEPDTSLDERYIADLLSRVSTSFAGLKIVLDCGNGAAFKLASDLFGRAGAEVVCIHQSPDGRNINLKCGALHVESLRDKVLESGADLGVAFDGDADRAIFVSGSGKIVDGDGVLLIVARELHKTGHLRSGTVVATVMSNLGLEKALARDGIRMVRTPVGDKYVLEEMLRIGAVIGGEQSGHVIFSEQSTTGDGMLTALRVVEIVRRSGKTLDELAQDLKVYPQKLVNVRVREKKKLEELPAIQQAIRESEAALAGTGRVLVRFSGTEPLARVMIEAEDRRLVEEFTTRIADVIRREIG